MQESGRNVHDILSEAQELWYAEADPTADVDGLDAGDKIAILASLAFGGRIKLEQVHCEGIRNISGSDISYAKKLGFVIKLLAIAKPQTPDNSDRQTPNDITALDIRVHPTLVPQDHPLASVNDVFNAILIEAEPLGQVMFFGPGAGSGPTASAVVADLVNVAALMTTTPKPQTNMHPLLACTHEHYCPIADTDTIVSRFFIRVLTNNHPGVIGKIGTAFGDADVSLDSIVQTDVTNDQAEIVVVTHQVKERKFRDALKDIKILQAVKKVDSVLRVL